MSEACLLMVAPPSHKLSRTFEELESEGWTCAVRLTFFISHKKLNENATRVPGRVLDKFCKIVRSPKNGHPFVKLKPGVHPRDVIEAMINGGA